MFQHFIGQVYLFETPPIQSSTQLSLDFTDDVVYSLDHERFKGELTREQEIKIIAFNDEMNELLGDGVYKQILHDNSFLTFSPNRLREVAIDMKNYPNKWSGLSYLNSPDPEDWEYSLMSLFSIIRNVGAGYYDMSEFIKSISKNWDNTIPQMLPLLQGCGVTIEKFFDLERNVTFKVATMLQDVNTLYNHIFADDVDVSPFIAKASHAFLPRLVYELEEYGLPRMVSKKIHNSGIIDLEDNSLPIHTIISHFNSLGGETVKNRIQNLHPFEDYILDYFFEGIQNAS